MQSLYCKSLTAYERLKTIEVKVGDVPLGGLNPLRVQSMTTTDTMDTLGTVEQSIRMIEAGCEYVRITAPSINEARNLENIKKELKRRGYSTPLIADIHFTPNAAEAAARIVEKVRINPGNFADKKRFENIEYTDVEYNAELERIRSRFLPLIKICKEYGTAMRIGTNHGSLSDRIMSRYGDTPLGMVESAMEFLRICEAENYSSVVLSMKSSNPQVMVQAYRLLINKMHAENMHYPLHLGVTEAGEGEDGRIKSAAGIGTLLEDGIGDTIRVSLTEDPEFEIPVAKILAGRYQLRKEEVIPPVTADLPYSPYVYTRRPVRRTGNIGQHEVPRVIADLSNANAVTTDSLKAAGYSYNAATDKWNISDQAADYIYTGNNVVDFEIPGTLGLIYNYETWLLNKGSRCYPLILDEQLPLKVFSDDMNFLLCRNIYDAGLRQLIDAVSNAVLIFETSLQHTMASLRRMFIEISSAGRNADIPVIIKTNYDDLTTEELQLYASTDNAGLFLDGFGDGIWITSSETANQALANKLSFGILQACRQRISKTEYISCPSCGRTLFDLQQTTARIRERTSHLKGIKIGIMGCIVNGPGEMADADYGYVGSGVGKITLYKGREVVQRNIDADKAVDALIELIRQHGDWVERPEDAVTFQ